LSKTLLIYQCLYCTLYMCLIELWRWLLHRLWWNKSSIVRLYHSFTRLPISQLINSCTCSFLRFLLQLYFLVSIFNKSFVATNSFYFEHLSPIWNTLCFLSSSMKVIYNCSNIKNNTIIIIIVSITKCSIVIGSPRAYLICNWRVITRVSYYSCPIWTFSNWIDSCNQTTMLHAGQANALK